MRTVRTLSTVAALALAGVAAFTGSSAGAPPTSTTAVSGTHTGSGYPTLTGVRYASHDGYDRVVFDFTGGTPDYRVAYGTLVAEGTGDTLPIAGAADLIVKFTFARAHDDAGHPTYPLTTLNPALPTLRQIRFGGDFEGHVPVGLGLRDRVGFRVTVLSGPPRFVVDVAHQPSTPFGFAPVTGAGATNAVVTGVRTGTHPGYDRIVYDVRGTAAPEFVVRYWGDTRVLLVRVGQTVYRMDTAHRHGFRAALLLSPTRLVVDVAH
jgi:hypothetical protein